MAIAFGRAKIIGRGNGQSLTACAAYRFGLRLKDERYGKMQDYSQCQDVFAAGIALPKDAPEWMRDLEKLTNAIERREDRSTRRNEAQLAREYIIALPHELNDAQREWLVKNIIKEGATREGMIAMWAIHAPGKAGDNRNHHAHVMLTMRDIDAADRDGFGEKRRDWNSKAMDKAFKGIIERESNKMLERCGVSERVSFSWDEGHVGTIHLGHEASALERKGVATEMGNANRAIAESNQRLAAIRQELQELELQKAAILADPGQVIETELSRSAREQNQPVEIASKAVSESENIPTMPEVAATAERAADAVEYVAASGLGAGLGALESLVNALTDFVAPTGKGKAPTAPKPTSQAAPDKPEWQRAEERLSTTSGTEAATDLNAQDWMKRNPRQARQEAIEEMARRNAQAAAAREELYRDDDDREHDRER